MIHWAAKYIGLKYEAGGRTTAGVDCWGLLRLIYHQEKDILLPLLPGIAAQGPLGICREVVRACEDWTEIAEPIDLCAVGMGTKKGGPVLHVGVWADTDGGRVIHSFQGGRVVAEPLYFLKMRGVQNIKFFTYGIRNRNT